MNDTTHKPGIHAEHLMHRRLKLKEVSEAHLTALTEQISALPEVDACRILTRGDEAMLEVAYDASIKNHPLEDIDRVLAAEGAAVADDRWTRLKRGYYDFTDQNVFENARHEPWSCHKVPPRK